MGGRSCLTRSLTRNICTTTCAVASYVHYMISFQMCRHSCAKFVIWSKMPLIVIEVFTLLLVLRIQHVILVSGLCQFKRSLLIFPWKCLNTTNAVSPLITNIGWGLPGSLRRSALERIKSDFNLRFMVSGGLTASWSEVGPQCGW